MCGYFGHITYRTHRVCPVAVPLTLCKLNGLDFHHYYRLRLSDLIYRAIHLAQQSTELLVRFRYAEKWRG